MPEEPEEQKAPVEAMALAQDIKPYTKEMPFLEAKCEAFARDIRLLEDKHAQVLRSVRVAEEELRKAQATFDCRTHKRFCGRCPMARAVQSARTILGQR